MSHCRTQMRDAVAALLADVSATVLKARVYPIDQVALPALLVYVKDEEITGGGFNALDRRVEVIVECLAKGPFVDDKLDELLLAVETRVSTQRLGGIAAPLIPRRIEYDVSAEGSTPIGRARLTYEALYRTSATDPEQAL